MRTEPAAAVEAFVAAVFEAPVDAATAALHEVDAAAFFFGMGDEAARAKMANVRREVENCILSEGLT